MAFRKYLQSQRERIGLSQTELARRLNLKPNTIHQYENGSRKPGHSILVGLAVELRTTTDYLLTGKHLGLPKGLDDRCVDIINYLVGTQVTEQQINLMHVVWQSFEKSSPRKDSAVLKNDNNLIKTET